MDGKRIDLPVALDLQDLLDISGNLFQCLVKVVLFSLIASLNFSSTRASIFSANLRTSPETGGPIVRGAGMPIGSIWALRHR